MLLIYLVYFLVVGTMLLIYLVFFLVVGTIVVDIFCIILGSWHNVVYFLVVGIVDIFCILLGSWHNVVDI